jgi:single-strand DNA-binding protein
MSDNEVHLVGRVSGDPQCKQLPSGDELVALRVVVPREARRPRAGSGEVRGSTVDTIDVTCWSAVTRKIAGRLTSGDQVEVTGALRRRFFRGGGGVQSRYDVEVRVLRRVRPGTV